MKSKLPYCIFIFTSITLMACITPMYYSDKLVTPVITDSTNTNFDFNSGVELLQRTKWIMKGEITHSVLKNIFISSNAKLVKGFTRDPIYGSIGASIGLYTNLSTSNSGETKNAQVQILAGYDQGRNIGTFKNPLIIGEHKMDNTFSINLDNDLLISVFTIRRYFQFNCVLNLNREDLIILSYRHSNISNSSFSLLNERYIYDEEDIYRNGASATLHEPAISFLTGKGVKFSIQVGKIFVVGNQSFAISPVFLAFGTQYGF